VGTTVLRNCNLIAHLVLIKGTQVKEAINKEFRMQVRCKKPEVFTKFLVESGHMERKDKHEF
jgi:hypothetical protein